MKDKRIRQMLIAKWVNCVVLVSLFTYLLVIPGINVIYYLNDNVLTGQGIPKIALRTHQSLTKRYEGWLEGRINSKRAAELTAHNVPGTEWPLFGTVFYLWATEAIEAEQKKQGVDTLLLPSSYARKTLRLAADFLVDSNQAKWVKDHWGDNYLHKENLFYRMLLMSGLLSYQNVSKDSRYENILRGQVMALARELDDSPYGLLDDYPGECYPIDIIAAIAVINRADKVLGTDHSMMVQRAVRGFQEGRLDLNTLLPSYNVDSRTGKALSSARGVGLSFMLIWAPEIWEHVAIDWYKRYKQMFWQERLGMVGFREFPHSVKNSDWWLDVDSGPVVNGFGVAATTFGIGAARSNNHFSDAYALSSEVIALSWPLSDGTLLGARLLSNMTDAPYLGETNLLFLMTRQPQLLGKSDYATKMPFIVYLIVAVYFLLGLGYIFREIRSLRGWIRNKDSFIIRNTKAQMAFWAIFLILGLWAFFCFNILLGILLVLVASIFPKGWIKKT